MSEAVGPHDIVRGGDVRLEPVDLPGAVKGLRAGVLLRAANGSVHIEVALVELEPGGWVAGHMHAFEESFYILSGALLFSLEGASYALERNDFGFAPVAGAHAWSNPNAKPVRWLRVRAPQPRLIGGAAPVYDAPRVDIPSVGRAPDERDPSVRCVGRFRDEDMPHPGPLAMPGYHGHNVRDVAIRMMVDDVLGARHHTLFMAEFAPTSTKGLAAEEHYHPFEEIYYLVDGAATTSFGGEEVDVKAGDLLWTGVNASHGFRNPGEVPVRWIEAQAPSPPQSDAFFFESKWKELEAWESPT
jgi:mannose-6-phosphate isomerase-like protein (cupin superfamily)